MGKIVIKIKKLTPGAEVPAYAHEGDAGFDLHASLGITLAPGERVQVSTGIAMEIPEGYVGLIWDKSGLSQKHGLKTLGGVVDAGYRGEVMVGIINLGTEPYVLEHGHKIAQMLIQRVEHPAIEAAAELSDTDRGAKGFGSTGK